MGGNVSVSVNSRQLADGKVELILVARGETEASWSKVYNGSLFLSMDAQSLDLLEAIPDARGAGPKFRLKRSGDVDPERLARMRFVLT